MPLYLGSEKVQIKFDGNRTLEFYKNPSTINGIKLISLDDYYLGDKNNLILTIKEDE